MKRKTSKREIKIKPSYKHRVPHKPTKVHRNKKKYTRKGKVKNKKDKGLLENMKEDTTNG